MANNEKNNELKISWIGIDGALCLCFALEAVFIGYCMMHDVDIVLGRLLPYSAMLVTLWRPVKSGERVGPPFQIAGVLYDNQELCHKKKPRRGEKRGVPQGLHRQALLRKGERGHRDEDPLY